MFLAAPGKPTRFKKAIYLSLSVTLGILLSLFAHAAIEMLYLKWAGNTGYAVVWHGGCALPPFLQIALLVLGMTGVFLLGRWWWKKVYVERVWAKRNLKFRQSRF